MGQPDKMLLRLSNSDGLIEEPGLLLLFMKHEMGLSYEFSLHDLA